MTRSKFIHLCDKIIKDPTSTTTYMNAYVRYALPNGDWVKLGADGVYLLHYQKVTYMLYIYSPGTLVVIL